MTVYSFKKINSLEVINNPSNFRPAFRHLMKQKKNGQGQPFTFSSRDHPSILVVGHLEKTRKGVYIYIEPNVICDDG